MEGYSKIIYYLLLMVYNVRQIETNSTTVDCFIICSFSTYQIQYKLLHSETILQIKLEELFHLLNFWIRINSGQLYSGLVQDKFVVKCGVTLVVNAWHLF